MVGTSAADTVARCQALIVHALTADRGERVVAEFVTEISRLPADHPARGGLAAGLIMVLELNETDLALDYLRELANLLAIADSDPPSTPHWPKTRMTAHTKAMLYAGATGQQNDPDVLKKQLASLLETVGAHPEAAKFSVFGDLMSDFLHAVDEGNLSELDRVSAALPAMIDERFGNDPRVSGIRAQLVEMGRFAAANRRNDLDTMRDSVTRLTEATRDLPEGNILRSTVDDFAKQTANLWQVFAEDGVRLTEDQLAAAAEAARSQDAPAAQRVLDYLSLGGAYIGDGIGVDPDRIAQGIASHRAALALTEPGDAHRSFCEYSVALGLYLWSEAAGSSDGLDEAVSLLESARDGLGGPHHPQWTEVTDLLANVRQRTGQARAAGELGLLAQRGYVWRVLRESNVASARDAVRDAAGSAIAAARKCLQVNNVTDAVRALDTGRGLLLYAATELPKVPARLRAAGHDDLARRWVADGGASAEVRRAAFAVLAEQPDANLLADPPSLTEIQTALAAVAADALVYLVPAEETQAGLAVIAPVDGPPAWLPLVNLDVRVEVERYLTALVASSRDLAAQYDDAPLTDSLAELCDWAWRAAIGPLLERYFDIGERRREPRIVLVPMGDLARIPWQAARRADGTYATELAEFSYAVSARMLCANAAQSAVAPTATGLIVADPDTAAEGSELVEARTEAHALRRGPYQGARYIGRRPNGSTSPSGAGTATQVRQWLTDLGPAAGGMLHLACHGCYEVEPTGTRAYLLLAPEQESARASRLTAEEIVVLLADAAERRIGLVVLAACHSARSVHGYDEAYSLGTAFLAGRVRSVLSTQWSVPDEETSALMYMFHHYRVADRLPARQALRQAQRWLLDKHRQPPAGMPARLISSVPEREQAAVLAWAGFVHYGQ
ncbi:CHAT domain-containing protein [Actinophytocola sediminis]